MPLITYRKALNDALAEEIIRDENVVLIGEEVAQYNGAYKVTEGLWQRFGDKRVVDAPISEAGFIGMGIGASMLGIRPVMELMFWSFAYVAWDQIINNAGQVRYTSGGLINCPIVIRGPANGGTNVGATHSHTPENFIANTPGLKVVCPATAYDAKGLMKAAIRDNNPVLFFEHVLLYNLTEDIPEDDYICALDQAEVVREGKDVTILTYSRMRHHCLKAVQQLEAEGIDVELIDLISLKPFDLETITRSIRKTHKVLVVEECMKTGGIGAELIALITENCFDDLDARPVRLSSQDIPTPYNGNLENLTIIQPHQIVEAAHQLKQGRI